MVEINDDEDDDYIDKGDAPEEIENAPLEEPLFDEEEAKASDFDTFAALWQNHFSNYSWNNNLYVKLLMHNFIGQFFKNIYIEKGGVKLDGRINVFLIAPQGAGKNTPFPPFQELCKKVRIEMEAFAKKDEAQRKLATTGTQDAESPVQAQDDVETDIKEDEVNKTMRATSLDDFSDSATVGSVQRFPIYDPEKKRVTLKKVYNIGVFSKDKTDIVMIKEARRIVAAMNDPKSMIVQYINLAAEPLWNHAPIIKILNSGEIKCWSEVSFVLTTYPTNLFTQELLNSGMIRRFCTFFNPLPVDRRIENAKIGISKLSNNAAEGFEELKKIGYTETEVLVDYIVNIIYANVRRRYVKEDYDELTGLYRILINVSPEAKQVYLDFIDKWGKKEKTYLPEISDIHLSILTTYLDHAVVIASHRALFDARNSINREDALYSIKIIDELLQSLLKLILKVFDFESNYYQKTSMNKHNEFLQATRIVLSQHTNGMGKMQLVDALISHAIANQLSFTSKHTVLNGLKRLLDDGVIKEESINGKEKEIVLT